MPFEASLLTSNDQISLLSFLSPVQKRLLMRIHHCKDIVRIVDARVRSSYG